jgi:hypothetical protein
MPSNASLEGDNDKSEAEVLRMARAIEMKKLQLEDAQAKIVTDEKMKDLIQFHSIAANNAAALAVRCEIGAKEGADAASGFADKATGAKVRVFFKKILLDSLSVTTFFLVLG